MPGHSIRTHTRLETPLAWGVPNAVKDSFSFSTSCAFLERYRLDRSSFWVISETLPLELQDHSGLEEGGGGTCYFKAGAP